MYSTCARILAGDVEAIAGSNERDFAKILKSTFWIRTIEQSDIFVHLFFSERSQAYRTL